MNHIEKYSDRELQEMQEVSTNFYRHIIGMGTEEGGRRIGDIMQIALVEINRELDKRKIRKEGIK